MHVPARPRMTYGAALLRGDGELHVVGRDDVVTFADPDGLVHRLVELADGSRTTAELARALLDAHPHAVEQDVLRTVAELAAADLLDGLPETSPSAGAALRAMPAAPAGYGTTSVPIRGIRASAGSSISS